MSDPTDTPTTDDGPGLGRLLWEEIRGPLVWWVSVLLGGAALAYLIEVLINGWHWVSLL